MVSRRGELGLLIRASLMRTLQALRETISLGLGTQVRIIPDEALTCLLIRRQNRDWNVGASDI